MSYSLSEASQRAESKGGPSTSSGHNVFRLVAAALLPVLLVLYPLLLLLDDLEPGFVRSVVNPHWFLLALIVIGIVAGRDVGTDAPISSPALRQTQGISRSVLAFVAAMVTGFWVWWRVGGGRIGVMVGLLTAVAIVGVVIEMGRARNVKVQSSRS